VPAFYSEGKKKHVNDLEFSLVRFQKVNYSDKKGDQKKASGAEQDERLRHHMDEDIVPIPLDLGKLFVSKSLSEGEPEREINKVLLFGYPGTGNDLSSVDRLPHFLYSCRKNLSHEKDRLSLGCRRVGT